MIKSMTGYGKGTAELKNGRLTVEIRSVNGKNADISIKSSLLPKDKELDIRKQLADTLGRGSIDMFITWEPSMGDNVKKINTETAAEYYRQLQELKEAVGADGQTDLLSIVMRMPDIIDSHKEEIITEENWPLVQEAINTALRNIDNYRRIEGEALYKDVTGRVANILDLDYKLESYEEERISVVKEKIVKAAEETGVKLNPERFEQEMIFYLEKLDINEEKIRLRQHCKYFMDTIDNEENPGKKLGFIIQEMGREINTTGSKSNHTEMQKLVVQMKDELEKIREQSLNIL